MQTNDNEYFRSSVTDEWNTPRPLTGQEQAEEQKQQTFRTKRHKTAQRAFSLAAPVAVVTVAATLVTTVAYTLTPCPVCGKTQCNYFDSYEGIPAQILYEGDVPTIQPEISNAENRLTYLDYSFGGVASQDQCDFLEMDGQTAGISDKPQLYFLYENGVDYSSHSGTSFEDTESGARLVYDSYSQDGVVVAYVELVYLPQGGSPEETETYGEYYLEKLFEQRQDYTYAVSACEQPNLWLRAYSAVPEVSAQQVLEAVGKPLVQPLPGSKVEVGSSLYMTLPASHYLRFCNMRWYGRFYRYFYGEDGHATTQRPVYTYSHGEDITEYYFAGSKNYGWDFYIEFTTRDWNAVADAWNELYRQAPATGHEHWGMTVPLQSMTVNGVTYDVYLDFLRHTEDGEYDGGTVRFVPRQQPTCRISVHIFNQKTTDPLSLSGKSLEEVASRDSDYMDVLSLFYPAGAEPNPLPTPEPSPTPTPEPTPTPTPEKKYAEPVTMYFYYEPYSEETGPTPMDATLVTELPIQLEELGILFPRYNYWSNYEGQYYVDGNLFWTEGGTTILAYIETIWLRDGSVPQESDRYGIDTEFYPKDLDLSQAKSYAMRVAEGGYYIRVYSFLDDLTAQEILDHTTDSVREFS